MESFEKTTMVNDFIDEIFKVNERGPKASVLKKHIDETFTKIKVFVVIMTLALLAFVFYPIYGYVANNDLIQLVPMQFPFIDQTTVSGSVVGNLIMVKMGIWAYVGSVGFDVFLARTIFNYCALLKLLQQDMADYVVMSKDIGDHSNHYRKMFFRNFLVKCQDKDRLHSNLLA